MRDVDVVFHLAAQIHVDKSYIEPKLTYEVNVMGTQNILEVARIYDAKKVIQASKSEVYGSGEYCPMDENHPLNAPHPYEEVIGELVSKNEIVCPCHLYIGEEAVATGVCSTLRKDDYVFSTHRSPGHYIAKGGDIKAMMAELYGKVTGCSKGRGSSMHLASPDVGLPGSSAIVAGTIPLGAAAK